MLYLYVLGILLNINAFFLLVKFFISKKFIRENFPIYSKRKFKENKNHFIILSPVLHEEKTILKYLEQLEKLDYDSKRYTIYIITTEKEYLDGRQENTITILNRYLKQSEAKNTHVIHYPKKDGFKAEQLNYAYRKLLTILPNDFINNSIIILFDADSVIHPETLKIIDDVIQEDIDVYQMPTLWFKNINHLPKNINGYLMQGFALNQTYHAIAYEIPMLESWFVPWRARYFMGHGLSIKGRLINKLSGFPDKIEDTRMGRVCSFLNIKSKVIPIFGVVEVAKSFPILINQISVWFFGASFVFQDYFFAKKTKVSIPFRRMITVIIYVFFKNFRWLNKGLLHVIGIVASIICSDYLLFSIFILSYISSTVFPSLIITKNAGWLLEPYQLQPIEGVKNKSFSVIGASFIYILSFIGPYLGLYKKIKAIIWKTIYLPKTKR